MSDTQRLPNDPRLRVRICGIDMVSPVLTASGTCGYGPEYADALDYSRTGAFTTKSITVHERPGNDPERLTEVRAGVLNAIGLANVGLERFMSEKLPFIRTMSTPVWVNVAGYDVRDYVTVCDAMNGASGVAGVELNVSCPNVSDGLMFGTDPQRLHDVVAACRVVLTAKPLIVKLTPNVTRISDLARAAIDGGADGLSMINTVVGMAIDARSNRPCLSNVTGGLSGPAIKPIALASIHEVYRTVAQRAGIPIIGMGGVQSTEDAVEFLLAGASAVAVGTALFVDPAIPVRIAEGLSAWLNAHDIGLVTDLIGQLKMS